MILAAGLGTRLRPLTNELPKPLLPIGDRPAIAHVASLLARAGVREAALNTHHLAEAFSPEVLNALPLALHVLHEPSILGTAGGVANARGALGDGPCLIWNGDILADVDVASLGSRHHASGAAATLVIAPLPLGQGTVGLGARGEVVRLRGERFGEERAGGDFLGIHVIGARVRELLPGEGCLVGDVYLPMLRRGEEIATAPYEGAWDDIGSLASYLAANRRWLASKGVGAWVGGGAVIDPRVTLDQSVVGRGAVIEGEGALTGCVVWPGAKALAPLMDAVVTPRGVVRLGA